MYDETPSTRVRALIERSLEVKRRLLDGDHVDVISRMGEGIAAAMAGGGKLLLCGNGGSAADAQHLAAELTVRLRPRVDRAPLAAIALTTDPSSITACGNDYSFEAYFERMLRALGRPGDVLLGITTSGRSPNVLKALAAAREMGVVPMGLLGGDGGPALALCDLAVVVPDLETGRIQEAHITIGHALMELIEDHLLAQGFLRAL